MARRLPGTAAASQPMTALRSGSDRVGMRLDSRRNLWHLRGKAGRKGAPEDKEVGLVQETFTIKSSTRQNGESTCPVGSLSEPG